MPGPVAIWSGRSHRAPRPFHAGSEPVTRAPSAASRTMTSTQNQAAGSVLFYVADPMCSWCWGFANVLSEIERELDPGVELRLVLGGLAPDDDQPMSPEMRAYVQRAWDAVGKRTGARFDPTFWERCSPRRSTWPACRAVLVAGERGRDMFEAIQRAYYTEARDPSDRATLLELAGELGLDVERFDILLDAPETQVRLEADFALRDRLGVTGYPSLVLERGAERISITQGWSDGALVRAALGNVGALGTG